MSLTQTLEELEKEVTRLEEKVGQTQKFCAHLIRLENKRQEALAYTDQQQPETMFKFSVIWEGHYINSEIPHRQLSKLLESNNSELEDYRKKKAKLENIKKLLENN